MGLLKMSALSLFLFVVVLGAKVSRKKNCGIYSIDADDLGILAQTEEEFQSLRRLVEWQEILAMKCLKVKQRKQKS